MKAEERHELKENSLQHWLQYGLVDFLKRNGSYLLLAASLCLLGYMLWKNHVEKQQAAARAAMAELSELENPDAANRAARLENVILEHKDIKPVVAIALRDLGNLYLRNVAAGTSDSAPGAAKVDVDNALSKAKDAFDRIIREYPDQPLAYDSARLGLGLIAEDNHDWTAARKIYEDLSPADASEGNVTAAVARARLKKLGDLQKAPPLAAMAPTTQESLPLLPSNLTLPPASGVIGPPLMLPPAPATQPASPAMLPPAPAVPAPAATKPK